MAPSPKPFERLLQAAATAQRANDFVSAERHAKAALALEPGSASAKFLLGVTYAKLGSAQESVRWLSEVVAQEPGSFEAAVSLANVLLETDAIAQACEVAKHAVELKPADATGHNLLGRCLLSLRQLAEACTAFEHALVLKPNMASAHYNLGKARQLCGRDGEAAAAFEQAARLAPTAQSVTSWGQSLLALGDFVGALACAEHAARLFPEAPSAHLLLCGALTELNRFDEANRALDRALELGSEESEPLAVAHRERPLGRISDANLHLRRAIAQNPAQLAAYDQLFQNQRTGPDDAELVERLDAILVAGNVSPTEAISAHFSLGKAREELGDFETAMAHYNEANRLARDMKMGTVVFDREHYKSYVDTLIASFLDPGLTLPQPVCSSEIPILIVGMMRSGTTLAEQILSSHAEVAGAGEQLFWTMRWAEACGSDDCGSVARRLGWDYVKFLESFAAGARRVTDKMPGNCMFCGLIHSSLPNAKFIHLRRNPVDTLLSIWATPNHMPHEGGHVKSDLVFVYREYLRLMEATRRGLPEDRLLEVHYEELVSEPERLTRKMLEFCGLEWDEACLKPEANLRTVLTPSAWQVRQPVYRHSVARYERFLPYLDEFAELLQPHDLGSGLQA